MSRTSLFRLFAAGSLALMLAACGGSHPAATSTIQEDDEEVVVDTSAVDMAEDPTVSVPVEARSPRQAMLDTVRAGRYDSGKMWTFDDPPTEYLQETYGFSPSDAWYEDARLSSVRIPGCSGSFVSPNGLLLTNHHCGRSHVADVSRPGENLLDEGFYARSIDEERAAPTMHADRLVRIEDVSDEVISAMEAAETDAERVQAREEAIEAIQERLTQEAGGEGFHTEVIALYNGGKFSAYVFRRYDDVRLVMTPELQLGYFGGDADNFTYPRYALDMTLFRVYDEDGEPLDTGDHYFEWTDDGVSEDELVFVIGNPGSTFRLETVAQLAFRRDVTDRKVLAFLDNRIEALQAYLDEVPEGTPGRDAIRNSLFGLLNGQKLYRGRVRALDDEVVMARRADAERQFREAIEEDPELQELYGTLIDDMAENVEEQRAFAGEFGTFLGFNPGYPNASATIRRALALHSFLAQGSPEASRQQVIEQLQAIGSQPDVLDRAFLVGRMELVQENLGGTEVAEAILQGRTPAAAAEATLAGTVLADSASAVQAVEVGSVTVDDPAVAVIAAMMPRLQTYGSAMAGLGAQQENVAAQLGRARFDVYGTAVPPDATFSLRIADGVVEGYRYNGTYAAPFTTFYGLYDHYYSYGPDSEWDLPQRWLNAMDEVDLSTPLNLVSTNDITGGNSGSPLIDRNQRLVGLIFDGNIESLEGDFILREGPARSVSVDARGMKEALDAVYDLDRIVVELETGALVATEAEADAM